MHNIFDYPEERFVSFGKLSALCRSAEIQMDNPEFVFVHQDSGTNSNSIVSSMVFGRHIEKLRRPVFFHLMHGETSSTLFKRDPVTKCEEESVESVDSAFKARNVESAVPFHVIISNSTLVNVTLIEVPRSQDASSFIKPAHRTLVCVENAKTWADCLSPEMAKRLDPTGARTLFLFCEFGQFLNSVTNSRDLNMYLSRCPFLPEEGKCFFVSKDSEEGADLQRLEDLQFDLRYQTAFGMGKFLRAMSDIVWMRHQAFVPQVSKVITSRQGEAESALQKARAQISLMNAHQLRNVANQYVMELLQGVEKLANGTADGNRQQNGQTLEEECAAQDFLWRHSDQAIVRVEAQRWDVTGWDSRLCGGRQFERLLDEFYKIVNNTPLPDIPQATIATCLGPFSLTSIPLEAAAFIAQHALSQVFETLIDQLFRRARYILGRLIDIAESRKQRSMAKKRPVTSLSSEAGNQLMSPSSQRASSTMGGPRPASSGVQGGVDSSFSVISPHFKSSVRDIYENHVSKLAWECRLRCLDELSCTKDIIIHDGISHSLSKKKPPSGGVEKAVQTARDLFDDAKMRLAQNIIALIHNALLIPVADNLLGVIQTEITSLSDEQYEYLFEVKASLVRLKNAEREAKQTLEQLEEEKKDFLAIQL